MLAGLFQIDCTKDTTESRHCVSYKTRRLSVGDRFGVRNLHLTPVRPSNRANLWAICALYVKYFSVPMRRPGTTTGKGATPYDLLLAALGS